ESIPSFRATADIAPGCCSEKPRHRFIRRTRSMTMLSVNVNKLALLRNSRGRNYPDLLYFAERFIALGVQGITVHPRPDERHIRRQDIYELANLLRAYPGVEFNIEGYPSQEFLQLIGEIQPHQCT